MERGNLWFTLIITQNNKCFYMLVKLMIPKMYKRYTYTEDFPISVLVHLKSIVFRNLFSSPPSSKGVYKPWSKLKYSLYAFTIVVLSWPGSVSSSSKWSRVRRKSLEIKWIKKIILVNRKTEKLAVKIKQNL